MNITKEIHPVIAQLKLEYNREPYLNTAKGAHIYALLNIEQHFSQV